MNPSLQRLYWHSRRGMLELDTLFRRYLDRHGETFDDQAIALMEALLCQQDQKLFDVFSGNSRLQDAAQQELFMRIIKCSEMS
ncbi:MAG: hypothetical protein EP297_11315 [Gammaproteobacteria bacterium]|nr:MAG: hypothetical protein EP297_11315 [Gammaproteobacteria bacterium]